MLPLISGILAGFYTGKYLGNLLYYRINRYLK